MRTLWSLMDGDTYRLLDRLPLNIDLPELYGERVLITGADGFIGRLIYDLVGELGGESIRCDVGAGNVMKYGELFDLFDAHRPTKVIHLAAHKYATTAEEVPATVAELNIQGTDNVVQICREFACDMVLASTCKAADPCTAYGASKLIAERVVQNYYRGRVFRLVNVIGSTGSVVEIWKNTPKDQPFKVVTSASRYFISPEEAAAFLVASLALTPSKVYAPTGLDLVEPFRIAARLDPTRDTEWMPLRRGDRKHERLVGEYEKAIQLKDTPSIMEVQQPWQVP